MEMFQNITIVLLIEWLIPSLYICYVSAYFSEFLREYLKQVVGKSGGEKVALFGGKLGESR